ncbi:MAG TPA: hypothetical protein VMZ25_07615 [Terriglobales bacterium]|nr:hypothetical protein [Terriglobales bacterium]
MRLEALAVEMPFVRAHPNRIPFKGVLTQVDVASQRAPAGARGRRVILTRQAADAALPSLIGMGLDYTPKLDGHDARLKVGLITGAEIVGTQLQIEGYIYGRDFPELMLELNSPNAPLGMSYELADARVEDVRATVWRLTEVIFTGAAILRRDKAAYADTSITIKNTGVTNNMDKQKTEQLIAVSQRMADVAEALSATVASMQAQHEELSVKIERIVAAVEQDSSLRERLAELEKTNGELTEKLAAKSEEKVRVPSARKTMPPTLGALLAKSGIEVSDAMDSAALDASLGPLSIEQRIAVKSQMAKAGLIV